MGETKTAQRGCKPIVIGIIALLIMVVLSLVLIIGVDTDWGKVELSRLTLASPDGDEISALLYKPKTATAETPAPAVLVCHGGGDMMEHMSPHCLELARRGYVIISFDVQGGHYSDIATGKSEGNQAGGQTVLKELQTYNFVDQSKISVLGYSMGGVYATNIAMAHEDEIAQLVTLGTMPATFKKTYNFNYAIVIGDSDESCLNKTQNYLPNYLKSEDIKRAFYNDYESEDVSALADVEVNKVYTVTGTDGVDYQYVTFMPKGIHGYYPVNDEAIKTVNYAVISVFGDGLNEGVNSIEDLGKMSSVWQIKDLGWFLELASIVLIIFLVMSQLLKSKAFAGLKLKAEKPVGFKMYSWQWWIALLILLVIPPLLFITGANGGGRSVLGINTSFFWLTSGTTTGFVTWQWVVAVAMLAFFLIFHFVWGKKNGGNAATYGLKVSDDGRFDITYLLKCLLFGIITIGAAYVLMALITKFTQQGLHFITMQMSILNAKRVLCWPLYFLYLIPYFLCTSLAYKAMGLSYDGTKKNFFKNLAFTTVFTVLGLLVFWAYFVSVLGSQHYVMEMFFNRTYTYGIAILPMCIGIGIGNAINTYVSSKTNSYWAGLCVAVLWGVWTICSPHGMARYFF